jgi:Tfp pilus assembly protein PilV
MSIKIKNEKGFTIIEALIAVLILVIALIPSIIVSSTILDIAAATTDQLIAAGLTQEGLEVVRAIRDRNWYLGLAYDSGLIGSWRVQYNSDAPIALGANPNLQIDVNGRYNYGSGTATKFRRTITITNIVPGVEIRVVSTVDWRSKDGSTGPGCAANRDCVTSEVHLYNWR